MIMRGWFWRYVFGAGIAVTTVSGDVGTFVLGVSMILVGAILGWHEPGGGLS